MMALSSAEFVEFMGVAPPSQGAGCAPARRESRERVLNQAGAGAVCGVLLGAAKSPPCSL